MTRKGITLTPATSLMAGSILSRRGRGRGRIFPFALVGTMLALAMITVAACGSSDDEAAGAGAGRPTPAAPADTPTSEPVASAPRTRAAGEVEGITFVVGEGSKATFTVTEQLASVALPFDAVISTTALSGEVHMDGLDSVVEIDLQQLSSDNSFRDRYIRSSMFAQHPTGVFTVKGLSGLPDGFASGETVTGQIQGELLVGGATAPLTFEVEARDDGEAVFILGRTTFTWDELQLPKPTARSVVSLDDEVRVEVLLSVTPGK